MLLTINSGCEDRVCTLCKHTKAPYLKKYSIDLNEFAAASLTKLLTSKILIRRNEDCV